MMQTDTLDPFTALARHTDPGTSHDAAARMAYGVATLETMVVQCLRAAPSGLTTDEIATHTGVRLVSVSPRMKPLELRGLVVRTAERRDGRIVWRAA